MRSGSKFDSNYKGLPTVYLYPRFWHLAAYEQVVSFMLRSEFSGQPLVRRLGRRTV